MEVCIYVHTVPTLLEGDDKRGVGGEDASMIRQGSRPASYLRTVAWEPATGIALLTATMLFISPNMLTSNYKPGVANKLPSVLLRRRSNRSGCEFVIARLQESRESNVAPTSPRANAPATSCPRLTGYSCPDSRLRLESALACTYICT